MKLVRCTIHPRQRDDVPVVRENSRILVMMPDECYCVGSSRPRRIASDGGSFTIPRE
jgi:hypothetical protein